jgi:hypothetical protein
MQLSGCSNGRLVLQWKVATRILACLSLLVAAMSASVPQTVILIRHGEKDSGNNLSPRGVQRSKCLAELFTNTTGPFPTPPSHLFAYTDKSSNRSMETLAPLSYRIGVAIDTDMGRDDVKGLVARIEMLPAEETMLVCWEHTVLTKIAKALGVVSPPSYPSSEYDWAWTVAGGKLTQVNENC